MIRAAPLLRAAAWMVLLSGCASPALRLPGEQAPLTGRLSLRVDVEPVRAMSAAFELSGNAQVGALALSSPLGNTLAQARWSADEAVLTTPDGQTRFADLDELAGKALGERVPMAALFDWLRGRPWAGASTTALPGSEAGFEQLGWHINLARFGEGWFEATRVAPPALTLRARLDHSAP